MKIPFTHKGWFGLCPVYMADVETESIRLEPRLPLTSWLINLSAFLYNLFGAEAFPITLTGEMRPAQTDRSRVNRRSVAQRN